MSETVDWTDPEQVKAAARKAYSDENAGASNRTEARDVFAVDRKAAVAACDLGLGVAVSYLVLACHTRGSTGITKASANAIENLVGINHHRAARHTDLDHGVNEASVRRAS